MLSRLAPHRTTFWSSFESEPALRGRKVLDIGCGDGLRCEEIAGQGARRVVGIDPCSDSLRTARDHLSKSRHAGVIELRDGTVHELDEKFDVIVSENVLEHVLDLPALLVRVREILQPGGRAYFRIGPLYHSPYGDHGWMQSVLPGNGRVRLPWGHLLFPQRWIFRRLEKRYGRPVRSVEDWPFLPLNRLTVEDYRRIFRECGMKIVLEKGDACVSWKGKLFGAASRVPRLERYCTLAMHYVLEKNPE